MTVILCELCKNPDLPIDPKTAHRYAEGWEQPRTQGGTNALRLRRVHDRYAHKMCVDRESNKINSQQGRLL